MYTRNLTDADSVMVVSTQPGFIGNNPMKDFERWMLVKEYQERYGPVRDESIYRNELKQEVLNPEFKEIPEDEYVYRDQDPDWLAITFIGQTPVRVRKIVRRGDYILPSGLHDGHRYYC